MEKKNKKKNLRFEMHCWNTVGTFKYLNIKYLK